MEKELYIYEGLHESVRFDGGRARQRLRQFEQERGLEQQLSALECGEKYLLAIWGRKRLALEEEIEMQPTWTPLGPFSIPHGQSHKFGGSRPSVSGRISAIAVDPEVPSHILIGSAAGGVWETRDGGDCWYPRTDDVGALAIGAVAFDPSNPSIVYAGTGEGNHYSDLGTGLLRSTDRGSNWESCATTPFLGQGFFALVVDPLDSEHILAATTGSLCESKDGGDTWILTLETKTWDVSMHPEVKGDPYSTSEVFAASRDGLQRSTDGGATWEAVDLPGAPLSWGQGGPMAGRMAVCHAPSDGNVVYVFAAGPPPQPDPDGYFAEVSTPYLWRRDAFGGEFTRIKPGSVLNDEMRTHQAWYDWFAAVAPDDCNVLYLGAIDVHKGEGIASDEATWSNISTKLSGDSIHGDQHAIAFDPQYPNTLYIGNDGGVYRSRDAGETWESLNKGLCITEIEYLAQHPEYDAWLITGTQDNGTLRYEGREAWTQVALGDGGDCGVNASAPYTCFHSFYELHLRRSTHGGAEDTWVPVLQEDDDSLFYPPVEVKDNVIAIAGECVFISSANGDQGSFRKVQLPSGPQAAKAVASALAIPESDKIIVGTAPGDGEPHGAGGDIYRIDRKEGIWHDQPSRLSRPRENGGYISDLYVDTHANRIWVTYSNIGGEHVHRSDDGGNSWTDVSEGLPDIPVNAIVVDPEKSDDVYVGTDVGVWRSTNAGDTWTLFSKGLPITIVGDLLFHEKARVLRAGTRSRGAWEVAVDQATRPDTELYLRNSIVDTGRSNPDPCGERVAPVAGHCDPFQPGALTNLWSSPDIKVDSAPYQRAYLSDVDFEVFQDEWVVGRTGLRHENARGLTRVFVQAHNRGLTPAQDVAVKVFYADASDGSLYPPELPPGFLAGFPTNAVLADSLWHQVAQHETMRSVEVGRPQVAGFEWEPPHTMRRAWLLAVVSAANDWVCTLERDVALAVRSNPKCAVKLVRVLP